MSIRWIKINTVCYDVSTTVHVRRGYVYTSTLHASPVPLDEVSNAFRPITPVGARHPIRIYAHSCVADVCSFGDSYVPLVRFNS